MRFCASSEMDMHLAAVHSKYRCPVCPVLRDTREEAKNHHKVCQARVREKKAETIAREEKDKTVASNKKDEGKGENAPTAADLSDNGGGKPGDSKEEMPEKNASYGTAKEEAAAADPSDDGGGKPGILKKRCPRKMHPMELPKKRLRP